jgi:hypothetical protein
MGRRSCKIAGRKVMCSCHDLLHDVTVIRSSGRLAVHILVGEASASLGKWMQQQISMCFEFSVVSEDLS